MFVCTRWIVSAIYAVVAYEVAILMEFAVRPDKPFVKAYTPCAERTRVRSPCQTSMLVGCGHVLRTSRLPRGVLCRYLSSCLLLLITELSTISLSNQCLYKRYRRGTISSFFYLLWGIFMWFQYIAVYGHFTEQNDRNLGKLVWWTHEYPINHTFEEKNDNLWW